MSIVETKGIFAILCYLSFPGLTLILQCEYENIHQACTVCLQKGLDCGANQKVWAREWKSQRTSPANDGALTRIPEAIEKDLADEDSTIEYIPREPPTPEYQALCSLDGLYLQFYWCASGIWVDLINNGMTNEKHPLAICAARRFGPH
jgi:hypothetical protein